MNISVSLKYQTLMKTIVLVDDKESIAKVISYYLSKDFNIKYFNNPLKAIAWLQDGNIPSLIISDIRMPEMDGVQCTQIIKVN